jgi:hypothetical protein
MGGLNKYIFTQQCKVEKTIFDKNMGERKRVKEDIKEEKKKKKPKKKKKLGIHSPP